MKPRLRTTDWLIASVAAGVAGLPALAVGEVLDLGDGHWWWDAAGVWCLAVFAVVWALAHERRPDRHRHDPPPRGWFAD